MSRLIDIDDERFWDILFDEACVEGKQAERIKTELKKIVAFDTEKVIAELEELHKKCENCPKFEKVFRQVAFEESIDIVKKGGLA